MSKGSLGKILMKTFLARGKTCARIFFSVNSFFFELARALSAETRTRKDVIIPKGFYTKDVDIAVEIF